MDAIQIGQKSYEMLPREGFSVAQSLTAADIYRRLASTKRFSAVMCLPLRSSCWSNPAEIDGGSAPVTQKQSEVNFNAVAPDYFRALGAPLLQGRDFDRRDTKDSPTVAIVSQSFAHQYLAGQDALGKRVRERSPKNQTPWATIVGVVGDVRRDSLDSPAAAEVYLPFIAKPDKSHVSRCSQCYESSGRGDGSPRGGAFT